MQTITIEPTFEAWREAARPLLAAGVDPRTLLWEDQAGPGSLFGGGESVPIEHAQVQPIRISRGFFNLAALVACHSDPSRWSALYTMAFRLVNGESHLLGVAADPGTKKLEEMAKAVRRDRHKMKAFVRFRKVGEVQGREQFVAWFEPTHHIVELTAPFFAKRFASFDWSILTPETCAHWDGVSLSFSKGVPKSQAPQEDALEDFWRTYYANIFNPGRVKLKAMQAEMPKKYWHNLPEARLIAGLTAGATPRVGEMIAKGGNTSRGHVSAKVPAGTRPPEEGAPSPSPEAALASGSDLSLTEIRDAALRCESCPLFERATQTVFGVGPADASLMLVGEQPGDEEDVAGKPFVGPAGQLLDRALGAAGIDRASCYLTNTVKHFKWKPGQRGKRRLHDKANESEVHRCKPWLLAEILRVQPDVIVCLGSTAARALVDPGLNVLENRGFVDPPPPALDASVLVTVHPSFLLRLRDPEQKDEAYQRFVRELATAADACGKR